MTNERGSPRSPEELVDVRHSRAEKAGRVRAQRDAINEAEPAIDKAIKVLAFEITNYKIPQTPDSERDSHLTATPTELATSIATFVEHAMPVLGEDLLRRWTSKPIPYSDDCGDAELDLSEDRHCTPRSGDGLDAAAALLTMALDGAPTEQIAASAKDWCSKLGEYRGAVPGGEPRENTVIGIAYYFRNALKAIGEWWLARIWDLGQEETAIRNGKPIRARASDRRTSGSPPSHSEDFTTVVWHGVRHAFTKSQAAVVRLLWQESEKCGGSLAEETIAERIRPDYPGGFRLRDVFKEADGEHAAWGTMIIMVRKGTYALASTVYPARSQENPT